MKIFLPLLLAVQLQAHEPDPGNGLKHLSASALIMAFTHHFLYQYSDMSEESTAIWSWVFTMSVGLGKEIGDEMTGGYFDHWDMLYNGVGASVVFTWTL